jgi:hypothetical protein
MTWDQAPKNENEISASRSPAPDIVPLHFSGQQRGIKVGYLTARLDFEAGNNIHSGNMEHSRVSGDPIQAPLRRIMPHVLGASISSELGLDIVQRPESRKLDRLASA